VRPKEQKENIFYYGGFAAATKNNLLFGAVEAAKGPCKRATGKRPKLREGGWRDEEGQTRHLKAVLSSKFPEALNRYNFIGPNTPDYYHLEDE